MNKNGGFSKLMRYYKQNISKLFLVSILCGSIAMAMHVVTRAVDSQKFSLIYTAHISATYSLQSGVSNITQEQCWEAVKNSNYTEEIKAYLGSYITYEKFLENLRFEITDEKITTFYTDESQVRAKRIVNTVTGKLCNYFADQNKVVYMSKNGKTIAEQVRVVDEPRIKINILYFTEIGILAGWVLGLAMWTIIYVGNGRIKNKSDIEEHLHIVLLAEVPHIKDIV